MRAHRWGWVISSTAALIAVAASACVGDDPQPQSAVDAGGTDATTAADQSAPADGQSPADAAVDGGFCDDKASAVLCEDFDRGSLASRGWVDRSTGGGSASLVASDRSAPYAFSARSAAVTDGGRSKGSVEHAIALPATWNHIRVTADLRFEKRENPLAPIHGFVFKSGPLEIGIADNGFGPSQPGDNQRQVYATVLGADGGIRFLVDFKQVPAGWGRWEVELTRADGGAITARVLRDGAPVDPANALVLDVSPTTTGTLEIGCWTNTSNGEAIRGVDDVLVTVD